MNRTLPTSLLGTLLVSLALTMGSCGEKDVPFVVDEDEIRRYMNEDATAIELFRTNGMINPQPFQVPFESATYTDSVLAVDREYFFILGSKDDLADYGNLGMLREAVVEVTDVFTVQTTRIFANATIVDTTERAIKRYAFFLKLGNDLQAYVGWSLWGYNGGGEIANVPVQLGHFDGSISRWNYGIYTQNLKKIPSAPFIRLTSIDTVTVGSRLVVTVDRTPLGEKPYFHLLSGQEADGHFTRAMIRTSGTDIDTVRTVRTNAPLYNFLYLQSFPDTLFQLRTSWCIPYRI